MTMHRILVGVDTSDASILALRRAAEEARLREAVLEVVYAFSPPEQVTAFTALPEQGPERARDVEQAREEYADRLGRWLQEVDVDLRGLEVEWSVLADRRPARALVERSRDADLVVVGSRGRGGFRGLKLGSVAEQVSRHAFAPVLVVRESTRE
jgi:nucleotide-binding universal stress UspA family protein